LAGSADFIAALRKVTVLPLSDAVVLLLEAHMLPETNGKDIVLISREQEKLKTHGTRAIESYTLVH
jgi:hypothetical protein